MKIERMKKEKSCKNLKLRPLTGLFYRQKATCMHCTERNIHTVTPGFVHLVE